MDGAAAGADHAQKLELGREVHVLELGDGLRVHQPDSGGERPGGHLGHPVAGRHEAVGFARHDGTLADGQDIGIACRHEAVDGHPTPRPDLQARVTGELVTWPDPRREHDQVDVQRIVLGEVQTTDPTAGGVGLDMGALMTEVHRHPEPLHMASEHCSAVVVYLHGHETWRELDDMGLESEVPESVGRLEAQ